MSMGVLRAQENTTSSAHQRIRHKKFRKSQQQHHQSTSNTLAFSINAFQGASSCTCTVIRLSEATRLYSATFWRVGVNSSAPNGCLSRATNCSARIRLSTCDIDEGRRRDVASRGGVADRLPNGSPRWAANCDARVRLVVGILEGPGHGGASLIDENWLSVLPSATVSISLPTGSRWSRKSIQG